MKNIYLIIIGFILVSNTFCQVDSNKREVSKHALRHDAISIYPLNLFNFLNPSFQIVYEHNLNSDFTAGLSAGIILPHSVFGFMGARLGHNSVNYKFSGFRFSGELKYILSESVSGKHNFFIGLESFYSKQSNNINSVFIKSNSESYTDFFNEHKDVSGLNLKIGKQFMFGRFLMELYGGIGVAHYSNTHENRDNPNDKIYGSLDEFLHKEGKYFRLTLPLNMKIGYRF